jgi:beta-glucanase (GH16 family)
METANRSPRRIEGFAHGKGLNYGAHIDLPEAPSSGFHVYGLIWTSTGITWFVDGHAYGHINAYRNWPFNHPFFLILDLAVGGNWPGGPSVGTHFPASMIISWVHIYRHVG